METVGGGGVGEAGAADERGGGGDGGFAGAFAAGHWRSLPKHAWSAAWAPGVSRLAIEQHALGQERGPFLSSIRNANQWSKAAARHSDQLAYLLFIDESGLDHRSSPYEVLAGISIEDSRTWNLITAIQEAEQSHFGQRITADAAELKGKNILKTKTFRLAGQMAAIPEDERLTLASSLLLEGQRAKAENRGPKITRAQLTALGQARLAFVSRVLEFCSQHQVRAFAAIVDRDAPRTKGDFLRKDYAYLFERFFYFLEEQPPSQYGLVIFDELEKSRSRLLLNQMGRYFQETAVGRMRSSRILPEPLFVHSDLTSLIQVADLVAYVIAWGVRIPPRMSRPRRIELEPFAKAVLDLRHRVVRQENDSPFYVWSFAVIDDLRPASEKR